MDDIVLTFDATLQPLLKQAGNRGRIRYPPDRRAPVKDIIEALYAASRAGVAQPRPPGLRGRERKSR